MTVCAVRRVRSQRDEERTGQMGMQLSLVEEMCAEFVESYPFIWTTTAH